MAIEVSVFLSKKANYKNNNKTRVNTMIYRSLFISLLFFINISHAISDNLWSDISPDNVAQARSSHSKLSLLPDEYRLQHLDEAGMRAELVASSNSSARKSAGNKTTDLEIPLPNGKFLSLKVIASSTMAPELAAKYPQIKTYKVEGKDNDGIYGAIDFTEQGFHAMLFMHDGSRLFIDPRKIANKRVYIVYYDKHYHPPGKKPFKCEIESHNHPEQQLESISYRIAHLYKSAQRSANQIKTYRLAMATTGEYTAFHGGTVLRAISEIATTVSRVNEIYQRDLAIKLELVANNELLIKTDTTTYSNSDATAALNTNTMEINRLIGTANYDIGHVMGTDGNTSRASLGSVCSTMYKARGITGSSQPLNDAFDIDFVAHEIGHQFGGNHSFNSETGGCEGNRTEGTAFEPGSGSTIMAYAGLCGNNDIQRHSDAMFHIKSIEQITNFVDNSACGTASSIQNQKPIVNAGSDYTIPAKTAFELTGSGNDSDGDSLTYSWEQTDVGNASDYATDTGNNTLFRSFLPQATSSRVFPSLNSIINNTESKGETLPTATRQLNFSLAVRDGKGGMASDDMLISVNGTNPFRITSHNTSGIISGATTVTWDVANTNAAPISCGEVNILLSKDAGLTFTNVSGATANDGSESITLPPNATESTTTRFKVKCANNVFFDISDANQTIQTPVRIQSTILSNVGSNLVADPGETIHITVPLQNNDTSLIATNINGALSSSTQGVTVVAAESQYLTIRPGSQSENTNSYLVNIPTNHSCGADLSFSLNTNYTLGTTQTNNLFNFTVPVGTPTAKSQTNSNQRAIPDVSSTTSQITLSGLGAISRPAINIDIDISHPYRGDLDIKLTSPQGTSVQLKQSDNNDDGDNIAGNYPLNLTPKQKLSVFNGENLDGVWTLKVSDTASGDTGTLNSWSLNYDSFSCEVFTNPDTDTDGVTDNIDNCPLHNNPRQGNLCTPYQLDNNQWHQISIPADGNNTTVADIFADDFLNAEYNEKWVLYSYDGNAYSKLELSNFVEQGKGYWIIQITGSAVDIDLPVNVLETSVQQSSQCASTFGCYEVILQAVANNGQWSMIGYPFENSLNSTSTEDIRIVTNSGDCGGTDGCTLEEAFTAKVFLNNLWSYNGEAYVDLLATSNIASWTGMWGRTLENSNGLEVRILFPLL